MKTRSLFAFCFYIALLATSPGSRAACLTQSIALGETKNATIAVDDCVDNNINGKIYYYDYYQFTATAGQKIAITNNSSSVDPDLLLIYPDGTTAYDDDSGGGTNARVPASGFLALSAAGRYAIIASTAVPQQTGAYTISLLSGDSAPTVTATVEYYNTTLKHYFTTAQPADIAFIDSGGAGPGWVRTGHAFNVWLKASDAPADATPVCRFYGTPGIGPNSHFYSADRGECELVKQDRGWQYEGIAFYIQVPTNGVCPANTQPVYRTYNNGAAANDSNHRFVVASWTYQQMAEQGWSQEGTVMCAAGVRVPTGLNGGTFSDPTNSAIVTVTPGVIPGSANVTSPTVRPAAQLPPGLGVVAAAGDQNVTRGAQGYTFTLNGDTSFTTTTAGAVKVALPFQATGIPAGDLASPVMIFVRLLDPRDGAVVDVTGDISVNGGNGSIVIETRGLPQQFTALVIYNPNMQSVTSEEAVATADPVGPVGQQKVIAAAWPAQSWCIIYNPANPVLIQAVRELLGLGSNPSAALIRSQVVNRIGAGAARAQRIYEKDGFIAPNLYIGRTCGGSTLRYNIHVVDQGDKFQSDDSDEVISPSGNHYGRLYVSNARLAKTAVQASARAVVAHEMHHAIQSSYGILGNSTKGYKEGTATVYGSTIVSAEVITVRNEVWSPTHSLMTPDIRSNGRAGWYSYANEDYFAYVGKQNNGGSLAYISGLYAQMRSDVGNVAEPTAPVLYASLDRYLRAAFSIGLTDSYLDFARQRLFSHNAASQLGHTGETTTGFAENLVKDTAGFADFGLQVSDCAKSAPGRRVWPSTIPPYSGRTIRIKPLGTLSAGDGPTVVVKITPHWGAIGGVWNGYTYRNSAIDTIKATNTFAAFGKTAGDQIVLFVANTNSQYPSNFTYDITCAGPVIDAITPNKGPVDTTVTLNGAGFGAANDTRTVTFAGVKATTVTWVSDTRVTAKVPANASTGPVVIDVNGIKSNGVPFEVIAQCSATQNAGGDTPDTRTIELGKPAGTFNFTYETYSQKDQLLVRYMGNVLHDSGCVGTGGNRTVRLSYAGSSTQISVQVIPNCAGGSGTSWNYSVSCP